MGVPASNPSANWRAQGVTFLLALTVGGLIVMSRLWLHERLGSNVSMLLAWPGIILAAIIGGFWPAILVTGLSIVVATMVGGPTLEPLELAIDVTFGVVFAAAGGLRRQGLTRAKADAARIAAIQAQMIRVSRLNAVGAMAGALAHELNQPLTAVANYLNAAQQLLDREDVPVEKVGDLLRKAGDQTLRAGQIVSRVRAGVDRGDVLTAAESASEMVREAVEVAIDGEAREGLTVRYAFDPGADRVLADRIQIQQVVLNLARNAVEAMADRPRRELRVGSGGGDPGWLQIYIADTGPGIAPQIADRLFQPFATARADGMGVGLSISRRIIEAHGGRIWVETNDDGGATFRFSLPRDPAEP